MVTKKTDILAALSINIILIVLYMKFLASYFGGTGIIYAYVIAFTICVYIYVLKKKEYIVDATLGFAFVVVMIYFLWLKKSWPLFIMEIGVFVIVYSISLFYFDWKKLDQR